MKTQKTNALQIVIADDSRALRDRLVILVSEIPEAVVVGVAKDGLEALEQVRTLQPAVLVLDVRMPQLSGLAVVKALRQEKNRVIVIAMASQTERAYRTQMLAAGADYFFSKATQMDELEELLRRLALRRGEKGLRSNLNRGETS